MTPAARMVAGVIVFYPVLPKKNSNVKQQMSNAENKTGVQLLLRFLAEPLYVEADS